MSFEFQVLSCELLDVFFLKIKLFCRRFSGFAYDDEVAAEVKALEELIRAAGLGEEVDFTTYYLAVYDGPHVLVERARRNELWFVRKTNEAIKA